MDRFSHQPCSPKWTIPSLPNTPWGFCVLGHVFGVLWNLRNQGGIDFMVSQGIVRDNGVAILRVEIFVDILWGLPEGGKQKMLHLDERTKLTKTTHATHPPKKNTTGIQAYLPLQWLMLPVTGMAEVWFHQCCVCWVEWMNLEFFMMGKWGFFLGMYIMEW